MDQGHDDGRGKNGTGLHVNEMKKIYFLSDAHLGSRAIANIGAREKRLCAFLDSIKDDAQAVYMLGDMFDFWFEYRHLVPKGMVRFLGKLAELTDSGVEVHLFTGNHDIWTFGYLEQECGVKIHHGPDTVDLKVGDKTSRFFLAHGDGLGEKSRSFRLIRLIFHNRTCQWMFSNVFPANWGAELGMRWAYYSRKKHEGYIENIDPATDPLVCFAKEHYREHPDINCYVFGHRHVEFDLIMSRSCRMVILGDSFRQCTYACWNGEEMVLDNFNRIST